MTLGGIKKEKGTEQKNGELRRRKRRGEEEEELQQNEGREGKKGSGEE